MNQPINSALAALRLARDEQARAVAHEQAKLAQIEDALATLEAGVDLGPPMPQDFRHLGIVDATSRLLEEVGTAMSTRDIADAIRARGVTTKSKRFIPTVYATLANSDLFARDNANWRLAKKKLP